MPDENLATCMSLIIRGRGPTYQDREENIAFEMRAILREKG